MRALIHFPIIHSPQDLGTLNTAVNQSRSEQQVQQHHAAIEQFWTMIETTLAGLRLNYSGLKLYQDGLPVCGKEKEIVAEVAATGSQNYLLLQSMLHQGAVLMGTESAELLLQEHALMTELLQSGEKNPSTLETAKILLSQRDDYIAQRINDTLHDNEMAILFLGFLHNIEDKLSNDIVLIQPLGKPTGHRCQHIMENN
jgi:hypothetical protein